MTTLALSLLRWLEPERAHGAALLALRSGLVRARPDAPDPRLAVPWLGQSLTSPIGLAAGFDKDAVAIRPLARLGLAALEVGTVTPRPQAGNPRPRLFRLPEERAVINRMGFNNAGFAPFLRRVRTAGRPVPLGANVGPNRDGGDPLDELPAMVAALSGVVDWVTVNVSSPNTPGLRDWQRPDRLAGLLRAMRDAAPDGPPLVVKLAPDLDEPDVPDIVGACVEGGAAGLVISNTTISRPGGLRGRHAGEAGGLSGPPLMERSTALLRLLARHSAGRLALAGAGGVSSGADVLAKLRAGASLVQLYTAFAYGGPALLARLRRELLAELAREGFANAAAAIGADL